MTDQRLPIAGWYPDPQTPGRLRYWDGTTWAAPVAPVPLGRPPARLDRSFARLSRLVGLGLTLIVLVSLARCAVDAWGVSMFGDAVATGDIAKARRFDDLRSACAIGMVVAALLTGISWCVWQYRLAASAPSGALRREPGMHVGSWFIPFANLVLPVQNVRDLGRYVGRTRAGLVGWWWAATLISGLLFQLASPGNEPVDTVETFNGLVTTDLVAAAVFALAAVLAGMIVRSLTLGGLATSVELSRAGSPSG